MSFEIQLYTTLSEVNRIRKDLTSYGTITGTLKNESSVMSPIILISADASALAHVNYMYIPSFNRYYFIQNVKSIRASLLEVQCRCDVLMTYADGILGNSAIIGRQENLWNLYLDDGSFKVYNNPNIVTKAFPSGFTTQSFVLAVAGSPQQSSSNASTNSIEQSSESLLEQTE